MNHPDIIAMTSHQTLISHPLYHCYQFQNFPPFILLSSISELVLPNDSEAIASTYFHFRGVVGSKNEAESNRFTEYYGNFHFHLSPPFLLLMHSMNHRFDEKCFLPTPHFRTGLTTCRSQSRNIVH